MKNKLSRDEVNELIRNSKFNVEELPEVERTEIKEDIKVVGQIECKKCHTVIDLKTTYYKASCKCGKISVEGSKEDIRIAGNPDDYKIINK